MKRICTFLVIPFIFLVAVTLKVSAQNDCNCWQQRDTTFHYVPFDQSLCTSECSVDVSPYYRNDDGATDLIILPFNFCFWGVNTDSVYINTNGNLTFGKYGLAYTTFSPDTFPQIATTVPPMIAPFWGDVDLVVGSGGTDAILYKITPHYMIVQWDSVRYYNHEDPNHTNSFQVIISDGTDPIVPIGNNVEFCYRQMQWTTGDASSGSGGFGGDPATVGANQGDGVRSIQIGLFDTPGINYYGQYPPAPNYDQVGWLDNKSFVFNLCAGTVAPLISGVSPCDTFKVCSGDSILIPFYFFSPVQGDSVWSNLFPPIPPGVRIVYNHPGPTDSLVISVVGSPSNIGYHTINVYGYDNATPQDTTFSSFVIEVDTAPHVQIAAHRDTICAGDTSNLIGGGGIYYLWSTGSTNSSITVSPPVTQTYTLGVSNGGCTKDTVIQVVVLPAPSPVITAIPDTICPTDSVHLIASGGGTYVWSTGKTTSSIWVNPLITQTYTLFASNGICGDSTVKSVFVNTIGNTTLTHTTDTLCPNNPVTITASGGTTYVWSNGATTSSITVSPDSTTTYTVYSSVTCAVDTLKQKVVIIPLPKPIITGTDWKCKGGKDTLKVSGGTSYVWQNGTTKTTYYTGDINADSTIKVYAYNSLGCIDSTTFAITVRPPPTVNNIIPPFTCANSPATITVTAFSSFPVTYSWSPGGATTSSITVEDSVPTTYTVIVSDGCVTTKTVRVTPDFPAISACCNDTILEGKDTTIFASGGKNIVSYLWIPPTGLNCDTCAKVIATPTVTTTYTVIGTDSLGCQSERLVTIYVEIPCFNFEVPNVFTPNYAGVSGVNNMFYIKTVNMNAWSILIFDRWGKEMFKSSNPYEYWTGTTEGGGQAPDGVYYYIINGTCQGNTYKRDGFLQLIR